MKTEKIETWLPVFKGFYGSNFEDDSVLEHTIFNEPDKVDSDLLEFIQGEGWEYISYEDYRGEMAKGITESVCKAMIEQNLITAYEYQSLISPKFYNFRNDSIHIEVAVNIDTLVKKCTKDNNLDILNLTDDFIAWIKDNYTSYDGFSSSYTNDPYLWINELLNGEDLEHRIGALLQLFIDYDSLELYEVCSEIDIGEYIDYKKMLNDINEKFGENLKDFSEVQGCMPGKIEKSFLQRLTGIGLFVDDPYGMKLSEFKGQYGLLNLTI